MELSQENVFDDQLMAVPKGFPPEMVMNELILPNYTYGWNDSSISALEQYQTPDFGLISPAPTEPDHNQFMAYSNYPTTIADSQCFIDSDFLALNHQLGSFCGASLGESELGFLGINNGLMEEGISSAYCTQITARNGMEMEVSDVKKAGKGKMKIDGQPSKNLMAERRRRKRLNDRLSMLRSVVPKISKMDRTSILGDSIDYMKELLEKINKLREEVKDMNFMNQMNYSMSNFEDLKPREIQVMRNHPKFQVERKKDETRIDICCAANPGLLLSTIRKLESMGLDIQQCVISCFNDFSLQASCCEAAGSRSTVSPEDVKQELFRNAGFGGRPL